MSCVVLGVHGDRQPEPSRPLHPVEQGDVVGRLEVVDPARAHEGLEPDDASLGQLVETVEVTRHEATPETEVDDRPASGSLDLEIERWPVDRRG